jgi:hypothetical protein
VTLSARTNLTRFRAIYSGFGKTFYRVSSQIESSFIKTFFHKLSQVARANWIVRFKELLTFHKGLFVSIITYNAAGWADRLNVQQKRKLLAAQRQVLICVTKAYRTVSADALTVLACSSPIDLLLSERVAIYKLEKYKDFSHGSFSFNFPTNSVDSEQIKVLYTQVKRETIQLWQQRWNVSAKGRLTYNYIQDIVAFTKSWFLRAFT